MITCEQIWIKRKSFQNWSTRVINIECGMSVDFIFSLPEVRPPNSFMYYDLWMIYMRVLMQQQQSEHTNMTIVIDGHRGMEE